MPSQPSLPADRALAGGPPTQGAHDDRTLGLQQPPRRATRQLAAAPRRLPARRAGGRCQAETHEPDCTGIGAECDHIGDKHDHSLANLRWLSKPCHRARTQAQARAGRAKLTQRRPPERHPGLA
jgi:hypothetical protein